MQKVKGAFADTGRIKRLTSRRRRIVWASVAGLLLAATVAGVLVVLIPVRLFGISHDPLEYSIERHTNTAFADCQLTNRPGVWLCDVFDVQTSGSRLYRVRVSNDGWWTARNAGKTIHGCLGFRDYVRLMDR